MQSIRLMRMNRTALLTELVRGFWVHDLLKLKEGSDREEKILQRVCFYLHSWWIIELVFNH